MHFSTFARSETVNSIELKLLLKFQLLLLKKIKHIIVGEIYIMESLIERIPIKENYKLMHEDYVRLKGPPNIARFCFVFEVAVAAAAFAISFWLTITSYTTETKITFEPLGSSYSCGVLSPRSDTEQFSTVTSELAQYSSARFDLNECLTILDTNGLNVCADGNRKDAVLSVQGLAATDDECIDMPMFHNYRFCHSSEVNTQLRSDLSDSYPRQTSGAPALTYSNTFYFMNQSGTAHSLVAEFDESNIKSQYYEYDNGLYVAARNEENKLYVHLLSPDHTEAEELIEVLGSSLGGIAVGNSAVIAAEVGTGKVTLRIYNLTTETQQIKDITCETSTLQSNTIYSLLSIGSDGYLYLVCNTAVSRDSLHEIFKLDMINFSPEILYADIGNVAVVNDDDDDDAPQSFVNQLISMVVIEDNAYLSTGSPNYNLLRVNLTDGSYLPTPAPTAAPTQAGPVGPPTSPGPLAITTAASISNKDQLVSLAGSIARRLLVNTLTTAVLHVTGYNNTGLATSVLQVVSEHTKLQEIDQPSSLSRPRRRLDQREYSVETVGVYSGTYLHNIDNSYIYFEDSNQTIFDISTQTFTQITTTLPQYYLATAVQLSYSYGICNGVVVSNWTVSAARDTAFYSLCDNING